MDKKQKLKNLQIRPQQGAVTPEMAKARREEKDRMKEEGVKVPPTHAETVAMETAKINEDHKRKTFNRFFRTLKQAEKMIYGEGETREARNMFGLPERRLPPKESFFNKDAKRFFENKKDEDEHEYVDKGPIQKNRNRPYLYNPKEEIRKQGLKPIDSPQRKMEHEDLQAFIASPQGKALIDSLDGKMGGFEIAENGRIWQEIVVGDRGKKQFQYYLDTIKPTSYGPSEIILTTHEKPNKKDMFSIVLQILNGKIGIKPDYL